MSKRIILIGYFCETIELCEKAGYVISGIIDRTDPNDDRYVYLGSDEYILNHSEDYNQIPIFAVPDSPQIRKQIYKKYHEKGFKFETVISPYAIVSKTAKIGEGCMIQDGCNVSSNTNIGKLVRINSMANVMHESVLGDYATVAPNAVILGRCKIEEEAYIGANATLLPGVTIGGGGVVGAGAVVTRTVEKNVTVVGIPAKPLHQLE